MTSLRPRGGWGETFVRLYLMSTVLVRSKLRNMYLGSTSLRKRVCVKSTKQVRALFRIRLGSQTLKVKLGPSKDRPESRDSLQSILRCKQVIVRWLDQTSFWPCIVYHPRRKRNEIAKSRDRLPKAHACGGCSPNSGSKQRSRA